MSGTIGGRTLNPKTLVQFNGIRCLSTSDVLMRGVAGRFRVSVKHDKPLTYEQFNKPFHIAHRKGWNSHNTGSFKYFGLRKPELAMDDIFIRKFITGTWHDLFVSEILIKRQYNLIRIAGIVQRTILPRKMYFLIGYTEELLSYWLQCPVKLEIQTIADKKEMVFKYV